MNTTVYVCVFVCTCVCVCVHVNPSAAGLYEVYKVSIVLQNNKHSLGRGDDLVEHQKFIIFFLFPDKVIPPKLSSMFTVDVIKH